jgi:hypothetical protein
MSERSVSEGLPVPGEIKPSRGNSGQKVICDWRLKKRCQCVACMFGMAHEYKKVRPGVVAKCPVVPHRKVYLVSADAVHLI